MKKVFLILIMCVSSLVMFGAGEHHTPDKTGCQFSLKIHSLLYIDGVLQGNTQDFGNHLEIVAYDQNNIIRGAKRPQYNPKVYGMYYLQTIWGFAGLEYTFKVYDNNSGQFLAVEFQNVTINGEIVNPIAWEANGVLGSATDPDYVAHINFITPATEPYTLDIAGYGEGTGNWYLIASPVTVAITPSADNGFLTNDFDLYYFDQDGDGEGNEWFNYEANTFTIQSKKGYLYASQTDTQLQFAGTACTDGDVPLEYSTATNISESMRGWNLIGNPLAVAATISQACYVMNEAGTDLQPAASGTLIPAMNGVFVKATGADQSVTFTPGNTSKEGAKIDINVLKDRGATIDRAIVSLDEGGTLPKFMLNPRNTKIYIEQGGDDYAVVSSNEDEIPVSFKAASNGTYTLNVAVQNAELDYLHLVDNLAGTDTDLLANPNYTFEANTGDYASRFTLVLRTTTGLVEHFAFYNGHNWTISNDGEALIQVVDVMGRILNSKEICGNAEINISQPAGVYMLRLVNGTDVKVQKVVVR